MAFDEIVWRPRIGSSGDDAWNVPGATKLDDTFDSSNPPTTVQVGDSSGYSSPPTLAQINAGSGINQVIAYYNYRAHNYNTAFGTSLSILSYLSAGGPYKVTDWTTNLFSKINLLRAAEGFTDNLVWPNSTPTTKKPIYGYYLAYLRKKLGISGTIKIAFRNSWRYARVDSPYGTPTSEGISSANTPNSLTPSRGWYGPGAFFTDERIRFIDSFNIPLFVGINAPTSYTYTIYCPNINNETFNIVCYSYNSAIGTPSLGTGYNGTFYNPSTNEGGIAVPLSGTTQYSSWTFSPGTTNLMGQAGAVYSLMTVSDLEYSGTDNPADAGYLNSWQTTSDFITFSY